MQQLTFDFLFRLILFLRLRLDAFWSQICKSNSLVSRVENFKTVNCLNWSRLKHQHTCINILKEYISKNEKCFEGEVNFKSSDGSREIQTYGDHRTQPSHQHSHLTQEKVDQDSENPLKVRTLFHIG